MNSNSDPKIRIPAPILAIVHITIAILLGAFLPLPFSVPVYVQWPGLGLTAIGFILGLMAAAEFRGNRAARASSKTTPGLVTTGIYRFTRNPIYLGFVCMLIGLPWSMSNYWGIILTWPLIVFMNNFTIKPEEADLEKRFKKEFTDYKARVRRWL